MGVLFSDKVRADSEVGTGPKPTPASEIIFRIKSSLLQARRILQNIFSGDVQQYCKGELLGNETVIAESKSKLWSNNQSAEIQLEAGKVHNLRMAIRRLNGVEIPAGRVFQFLVSCRASGQVERVRARARASRRLHHSKRWRRALPVVKRSL